MRPNNLSFPLSGIVLLPADSDALLAAALAVRRAVFTVEHGIPQSVEQDDLDHPGADCAHFLARLGGRDAAALRCIFPAPGVVRLQRFCVLPELRGRGVGKAVLTELENRYRPAMRRVELDAKFRVEGFYKACGYRTVSEIFLEAGAEHVKMVKDL